LKSEKTAGEVKALRCKAIALQADVANKAEVGKVVKAALSEFGKIDILVNTAGLTAGGGPFARTVRKELGKRYKC
jgi:3-oxoacyl-[acyl-carrier protein] reductase